MGGFSLSSPRPSDLRCEEMIIESLCRAQQSAYFIQKKKKKNLSFSEETQKGSSDCESSFLHLRQCWVESGFIIQSLDGPSIKITQNVLIHFPGLFAFPSFIFEFLPLKRLQL